MSVKCPACGFDSPDEAKWCDFCKEPFRKKTTDAAPAEEPAPPAPAAQPKRPSLKYYQPVPAKQPPAASPAPAPSVPAIELKDDEKVPAVPPWFRYAAWAFLGVWVVAGMILAGIFYGRYKVSQEAPAAPALRFSPP